MYCSNCGAQNPDQAGFCTSCGQSLAENTAAAQAPVAIPVNDFESQAMRKKATTCMILGIIACVVAWYPVTSIAAIILGAMAISRAKIIKAYYDSVSQKWPGTALAGKITGTVGLVGGILMTVVYVVYFILIIFVISNTTGYSKEIFELPEMF